MTTISFAQCGNDRRFFCFKMFEQARQTHHASQGCHAREDGHPVAASPL